MHSTSISLPNGAMRLEEEQRDFILRFLYLKNVQGVEDVDVDVDGGIVTLRGQVPSTRDRDLCARYCRHVPGVRRVRNELSTDEETGADQRQLVRA